LSLEGRKKSAGEEKAVRNKVHDEVKPSWIYVAKIRYLYH
jgi:hypothetical protein